MTADRRRPEKYVLKVWRKGVFKWVEKGGENALQHFTKQDQPQVGVWSSSTEEGKKI